MANRSCAFRGAAAVWCVWALAHASGALAAALAPREPAGAHFLSGQSLQGKGDYKRAIASLDAAIRLDPGHVGAYVNRGQCKRNLAPPDYAGALQDFSTALKLDPKSASALNSRGVTYLRMGDFAKAMADYNRAIEVAPSYPTAYLNRASLRLHNKDADGALADANTLVKLAPDKANNHTLRAEIKLALKDIAGAVADVNLAIGLDPKYAPGWHVRSILRDLAGDLAGAWQDLQRSLELDPTDATALAWAERLTEKLTKEGRVAVAPPPAKQVPAVVVAPPPRLLTPDTPRPAPVEPGPVVAPPPRLLTPDTPRPTPVEPVTPVQPPRVVQPPDDEPPPKPTPPKPPKPVKFLPSDPNDVATWNLPDTPWRKGDQPLPDELSDAQLKTLATQFDVAKLDYNEFHRAVTTAMACMRLVHGDMTDEDDQRLDAKWAPLLEFPSPEAVDYFNKLNPLLLEFLKARGALMIVLGEFDRAWQEAGLGAGYENLDAMSEALAEAGAHKDTAASLRQRLERIGKDIEALGDPPNPYAARHQRRKVFAAYLKRATAVRILPLKQEVLPGGVCRFKPVVRDAPPKASFEWSFGDQATAAKTAADAVAHTYPKLGKYQVKLTVRDTATGRVVGEAAASASVAAAAPNAGSYVMISSTCFAEKHKDVRVGAAGNFMTERWELHDDDKNPAKVTRSCVLKYSWTHPPGRFDPQTLNLVQLKTAIEVTEPLGDWLARWLPTQYHVYFFQQDETGIVEQIANGKFKDLSAQAILMRGMKMRPLAEFMGDNPALMKGKAGYPEHVDSAEKRKAFPIVETCTGQAVKVVGTEYPFAVVKVWVRGGSLDGYACYVYAFDPSGQKEPIALKDSKDAGGADTVATVPDDPRTARIEELRKDIESIQGSLARWRSEAKDQDPKRAIELSNRIIDSLTEISRAEDLIASIETGTIVHRRSVAEDVQFQQLIQSCHEDVLRAKVIADNALRVGQLQKSFRRGVGNLHNLITLLDPEDAKTCREWANQKLDSKAIMERDTKKLQRMTNAMLAKVQGQAFRAEAEAMGTINTLEEIKFGCGLALIVVAPFAVAEGVLAGSAYMTHAPGLIASGYGCGTGYIEGGVKGAVLTGLRFKFAAVDVVLAAMDGFQQEEGGSWSGAAKNAALTLLLRKSCELSANRIVQGRLDAASAAASAASAAAARPGKIKAWGEFVKDKNFKQDQQHGDSLIRNYQQANNAFQAMASGKTPVGQMTDQYVAANAKALVKTPEGRALIDAMAQVEYSYTAKMGFQSTTLPGAVKQSYNKNLGTFLEKPVLARTKELMAALGWNDFEIGQFRHSANNKKVGFDKDMGVKEEGWSPKKGGKDMDLLEFQKDLNECLDYAFRQKTDNRSAKAADWRGTTSKDSESYLDKAVLDLKGLRDKGINPMSRLNPDLAAETGQVNVTKVRHALAKGTRAGQAEAFRTTRKELETKIIDDLPDGSPEKAYFEKALTIVKEGATDPHAAMQKLQSFTGGDIRDLALQVKQQLINMIMTAPR